MSGDSKQTCLSISEFIGPMQSIRGSGKLGFGIRISGPGFQSPAYSWYPKSTDEESESSYWNPRSTAWNSESKTVLREGEQNENQLGQFCHKNYLHDYGKLTIVESSILRPSCGLLILIFSFILLIFSKILAFQATLNLDYK